MNAARGLSHTLKRRTRITLLTSRMDSGSGVACR